MTRVVFADIDGVLATGNTRPVGTLDPVLVARLDRLCREAGAVVVISSSWRNMGLGSLLVRLRRAGFDGEVLGVTPELPDDTRGTEISLWLSHHGVGAGYVILDDDTDLHPHEAHLVRTRSTVGLTEGDVDYALAILEGR